MQISLYIVKFSMLVKQFRLNKKSTISCLECHSIEIEIVQNSEKHSMTPINTQCSHS